MFSLALFSLLFVSKSNAWDSSNTDFYTIKDVIVDSKYNDFMLEPGDGKTIVYTGTACTYGHRVKWSIDAIGAKEMLAIALTAKTTGSTVRILTDGCVGGYPVLGRIELIDGTP